jgi:hypothetical protein
VIAPLGALDQDSVGLEITRHRPLRFPRLTPWVESRRGNAYRDRPRSRAPGVEGGAMSIAQLSCRAQVRFEA